MPSNIYFGGCYHLDHNRAIKDNNRPFKDVKEMNEIIIENHNSIVKPNDMFYCLGDLIVTSSEGTISSKDRTEALLKRLNGKKYIIFGDHDEKLRRLKEHFMGAWDYKMLKISNLNFALFHYPISYWEKHGQPNSIHLHSHSHGRGYGILKDRSRELILDVGIDNAKKLLGNYVPFSLDDVKNILRQKDYWQAANVKPNF